ncbi:MAG TPA: SUMF1/EgtB/PvdO family nonheme iron enzyme [Polyangia bacterium]|jgi:formylglycine-generating enzyme required for sulfatase activity
MRVARGWTLAGAAAVALVVGCGVGERQAGLQPDGGPPTGCASGLCAVPPGAFVMGSPEDESCRAADETPHQVVLTRGFFMSQTEIRQADFAALMGYNPSKYGACGDDCPVEMVYWDEAAAYANARSDADGLPRCYACTATPAGNPPTCTVAPALDAAGTSIYACAGWRLPTEAEFEYAYRGGATTALYSGALGSCDGSDPAADAISWYWGDSTEDGGPHAAGLKTPNALGLYDMAGNVAEWVHDGDQVWSGDPVTDPVAPPSSEGRHGLRGGSWQYSAAALRAASRQVESGRDARGYWGFRVVRTFP